MIVCLGEQTNVHGTVTERYEIGKGTRRTEVNKRVNTGDRESRRGQEKTFEIFETERMNREGLTC